MRIACLILTISFCFPTSAWCRDDPIKLGFIYCFSGRLSHYGYGAKQGAGIAIDEINKAGGLLGRKVVAYFEDSRLKPPVGVAAARKLIEKDGVDVVLGIVSSAVAQAVSPVVNDFRTPLIITLAMNPDMTGRLCAPYTFRININGPQSFRSAALLAKDLDVTKWTTLGPDYIFGYQSYEYFEKYLKQMRPDVEFAKKPNIYFAPVVTTDFRPYIKKLMKSDANGCLVTLYGGNFVDFVKQGAAMNLFDGRITFLMSLSYSGDVLHGLGLSMPKGIWLSGQYWFQANAKPANRRFVVAYAKKYMFFPDFNAQNAYTGVKVYAAAVKKAGTTDKKAVAEALEGLTIEAPIGTLTIRPEDHQAILDAVWGVTSKYMPRWRCRMLDPIKIFPGKDVIRPIEETGCKR
jgi:branched-chain amino acid transport system substrate-binding protein